MVTTLLVQTTPSHVHASVLPVHPARPEAAQLLLLMAVRRASRPSVGVGAWGGGGGGAGHAVPMPVPELDTSVAFQVPGIVPHMRELLVSTRRVSAPMPPGQDVGMVDCSWLSARFKPCGRTATQ